MGKGEGEGEVSTSLDYTSKPSSCRMCHNQGHHKVNSDTCERKLYTDLGRKRERKKGDGWVEQETYPPEHKTCVGMEKD